MTRPAGPPIATLVDRSALDEVSKRFHTDPVFKAKVSVAVGMMRHHYAKDHDGKRMSDAEVALAKYAAALGVMVADESNGVQPFNPLDACDCDGPPHALVCATVAPGLLDNASG